jgi:signal transduction histidine kinase
VKTSSYPLNLAPVVAAVDDSPDDLALLVRMLSRRQIDVRPIESGFKALETIRTLQPDLILLDISMAGLDGYEVCRLLKADPLCVDIPVIFVSSYSEAEEKMEAFESGAVDYISKPIRANEIAARISAHVTLRRQQLRLIESHRQLKELEQLRDGLTHMVVHDMRSLLLPLMMGLDMIAADSKRGLPSQKDLISSCRLSVVNLVDMSTQMLELNRLESGTIQLKRERVQLRTLAAEAVGLLTASAAGRSLVLRADNTPPVEIESSLIRRVLLNLIGNAIKFTGPAARIEVSLEHVGAYHRIEVTDDGPGIPAGARQRIFDKFYHSENSNSRSGYGLGLAFAKLAVEAHGGEIGVISEPGQGSKFWLTLPATTPGQV